MADSGIDAPVVGSHQTYLEANAAAIRAMPAPWDVGLDRPVRHVFGANQLRNQGYYSAGLISAEETSMLKGYVAPAVPSPVVAATMLGVLAKVSRTDTQHYILVTLDDILSCENDVEDV
jgi:hypothetical protein